MMIKMTNQRGFTLTELMISVAIGLVVTSGVLGVFLAVNGSSTDTLKQSKLNGQITGAIGIMANDIKRAGFWGAMGLDESVTPDINPFNQFNSTTLEVRTGNVLLPVSDYVTGGDNIGGDCIVYTYDANQDGLLEAAGDDADIVGFRLTDGVIQMRLNGDAAGNPPHNSCADANDNWQNLTDANLINITELTFQLGNNIDDVDDGGSICINNTEPNGFDDDGANGIDDAAEADCYQQPPTVGDGQTTVEIREVRITVTGVLIGDPLTSMTLTEDVLIRNNYVRTW
jgi:prepilin peptidase dependent protein B